MLRGRADACRQIDLVLRNARDGRSGVLLLVAEPGLGKTALLDYAARRARGMQVVRARGVESESELAFAGLLELVRPLLGLLERLPGPQADVLGAALGLAPAPPGERTGFAVGAATLTLLATAAEDRPLLVLVDDLHWVDAASREAILFAARRLAADRAGVVLAARPDEQASSADRGVTTLALEGVAAPAAAEILHDASGVAVQPSVASFLCAATAGNPLALVELSALLSPAQLTGRQAIPEPVPIGTDLGRAFLHELSALPGGDRGMLLLAAASQTGEPAPVLEAAHRLRLDPDALERAETARILRIEHGRVDFRHPLLRSAVYHSAEPAERRRAHAALAAALDHAGAVDRRAWHLAAAAAGPDENAAAALEHAAELAQRRGAQAAAAASWERAAELAPVVERRSRNLLAAARASYLVGRQEHALALLDDALTSTSDPAARADIQQLRARILVFAGATETALELWLAEAGRIEHVEQARAAAILTEASLAAAMTGEVDRVLDLTRRALAASNGADDALRLAAVAAHCNALILHGEAPRALPLLERYQEAFDTADPLTLAPVLVQPVGHARVWVEQYDRARSTLERAVATARHADAISLLPFPLACLAELDLRTGRWAAAHAHAAESAQLAEEIGQANELCFSRATLATVHAAAGRDAECRTSAAQALAGASELGIGSIPVYVGSALGLLELGLGRNERALAELEPVEALVRRYRCREPGVVWWRADWVEALIRAGRTTDARRELDALTDEATRTGRVWALAAAARCRGLIADEHDVDASFAEALRLHEHTTTPFERARTELCYGERLRRLRRRRDARDPLRRALATFTHLNAAPWAARAKSELRATGERRLADASAPGWRRLTPQELQVALLIAEGATNREAAEALFLSAKTVGFHLGNVYRKLEIRSRTELARLVTTDIRAPAIETARRSRGEAVST